MTDTVDWPLRTGIETLSIRCDLGTRPTDRSLSDLRRFSSPYGTRYDLRDRPPGVTYVKVENSPKGWRVGAEVNLTTLLHGPGSEVGSLSAGEVELSTRLLLHTLPRMLPGIRLPDETWRYDVPRFDPSTTLVLPDDFLPSELVNAAFRTWRQRHTARQVVSLHESSGATATMRLSKNLSRSVYDKTAASRSQGKDCPDRVLRLESRVMPKRPIPLSNLGELVSSSGQEIAALAASIGTVVRSATQVTIHTFVEAQKALGETPNVSEALTLASVQQLLGDSGDVELLMQEGMSQRTAYRRRARLYQLLSVATDELQDRAAEDVFGMTEVLLARKLMEDLAEGTDPVRT